MGSVSRRWSRSLVWTLGGFMLAAAGLGPLTARRAADKGGADVQTPFVVLGYCDQGMRIQNGDYSEVMIQPPGSNLHAQVLRRGNEPELISSGVTVKYWLPGNTHSADKTNFWDYPQPLLGMPAPNVGLTGHRLSGTLSPTSDDWAVTGIPVTPTDDRGRESPYPLAVLTVTQNGQVVAQSRTVIPVSTEINCTMCHGSQTQSAESDMLTRHDQMHGTTLMSERPVLCARCHADASLNMAGQAGVSNLSAAIHGSHANLVTTLPLTVECWACHPGLRTKHQRDNHTRSTACDSCHGTTADVGNPARRPWVDLPHCYDCHGTTGHDYEQAGRLYKDSFGHGHVHCSACHGSPHAVNEATTDADNTQAVLLQGHAGKIDTCLVCHTVQPTEAFFHRVEH